MFHRHDNFVDDDQQKVASDVLSKIDKRTLGLGNVANIKDMITSPRNPNANDDKTKGYGLRSIWIDSDQNKAFICVQDDERAAVWKELGVIGGGGAITQADFDSFFSRKTTSDLAEGDNLYHDNDKIALHPDIQLTKSIAIKLGTPSVHTIDTSSGSWTTIAYLATQNNISYMIEARIVAKRVDQLVESAAYTITGMYRNTNNTLHHNVKDKLELEENSSWNVDTSSSENYITINVRGEVNKIITWKAYVMVYEV